MVSLLFLCNRCKCHLTISAAPVGALACVCDCLCVYLFVCCSTVCFNLYLLLPLPPFVGIMNLNFMTQNTLSEWRLPGRPLRRLWRAGGQSGAESGLVLSTTSNTLCCAANGPREMNAARAVCPIYWMGITSARGSLVALIVSYLRATLKCSP